MAKIRNLGLLSKEERLYLQSIKAGVDPRRKISNPSRAKARILEFQRELHNAIEVFVEDVVLMSATRQLSNDQESTVPFAPQRVEQDLARSVIANRIGFLRYFFLDSPLHYLLVVGLDAATSHVPNQKQALLATMVLFLKLAETPKELARDDSRFAKRISSYRETLTFLDELFKPLKEEFLRNAESKEDVEWLVEHTNEREALLVLYFEGAIARSRTDRDAGKEVGIHRDKISEIMDAPRRRVTRHLTTLGEKGLVKGWKHKYVITDRGEDAVTLLLLSSPHLYSIVEGYEARKSSK